LLVIRKILPDRLIEHRGLNSLFSFFVYTLLSPFRVKNFFNLYSSKRKVNQKNNFLVLIAPSQKIKKSRPPVEAGEKD